MAELAGPRSLTRRHSFSGEPPTRVTGIGSGSLTGLSLRGSDTHCFGDNAAGELDPAQDGAYFRRPQELTTLSSRPLRVPDL